jgi:hypothetical protein
MKPSRDETEPLQQDAFDLLQIYPFSFAIFTIIVFLGAVVKMGHLAASPHVQTWIGFWPTWIAYLPLLFIVLAYIIHRIRGGPSKLASLMGLVGPSVLLFVGGYKVAISALTLSAAFGTMDCTANIEMYQLGTEWQAAVDFKASCNASAASGGIAPAIITECAGYEGMLKKHPSWTYLSFLETSTGCGGWCEPAHTLWVYPGEVQDPCSSAAGEALNTEVIYPSMQVAIYDIIILFLGTVGIALLGPKVSKNGIEW